jgi:hypothetical protein
MIGHDLAAHIDQLRQALEGANRPAALFVGAGCPMAVPNAAKDGPLIPDVRKMTEILRERLRDSEVSATFAKLEAVLKVDGKNDADLEYMLSLVRALKDVAGKDTARNLDREELDALDQAISAQIVMLAEPELPRKETAYHDVMSWVGGASRTIPVEIFTTNYDVLAEQSMEESGVPFFDGFVGAHKPFFEVRAIEDDELPPRWARLWKLHGSINWCRAKSGRVIRDYTATDHRERRLIHPSHLKYDESRRMPYLALHDRLRHVLRQPDVVIVSCGYSFRDEHLNEILQEGLQRNPTAVFYGLLFGDLDSYPEATDLAARTDASNLLLIAEAEAVVSRERALWREVEDAETLAGLPGVRVEKAKPRCELGDFAKLGEFLAALSGAS